MQNILIEYLEQAKIGRKQSHKNLAIFPILSTYALALDYLLLDEALSEGAIEVVEVDREGAVPELKVSNKGNGIDTIDLEITQKPSGWSASLSSPSVSIDAKKNTTVTLTVRPPSTERNIIGDIKVKATSEGNATKTHEIIISTEVRQVFGVSLSVQNNIQYVKKGGSANYLITLKNTGNGQDSFTLEVSNPHSGEGWQGQLSAYNIPDLQYNATTIVSFTVIAPVIADYNDFGSNFAGTYIGKFYL